MAHQTPEWLLGDPLAPDGLVAAMYDVVPPFSRYWAGSATTPTRHGTRAQNVAISGLTTPKGVVGTLARIALGLKWHPPIGHGA